MDMKVCNKYSVRYFLLENLIHLGAKKIAAYWSSNEMSNLLDIQKYRNSIGFGSFSSILVEKPTPVTEVFCFSLEVEFLCSSCGNKLSKRANVTQTQKK